jgi:hypothetical protein
MWWDAGQQPYNSGAEVDRRLPVAVSLDHLDTLAHGLTVFLPTPNDQALSGERASEASAPERQRGPRVRCSAMLGVAFLSKLNRRIRYASGPSPSNRTAVAYGCKPGADSGNS